MEKEELELGEVVEISDPYIIEKGKISNTSSRQANLIDSEEGYRFETRSTWYEFKLEEPIYCSSITIRSHNQDIKGTQIECYNSFKKCYASTIGLKDSPGVITFPKQIITSFRIKPEKRRVNKIVFKEISISGFESSDFQKLSEQYKELEKSKKIFLEEEEKLKSYEESLDEKSERIEEQLENKNEELANLYQSITESTEEQEELTSQINEKKDSLTNVNKKIDTLQKDLQSLNNTLNKTKIELESKNKKLIEVSDKLKDKERDNSLIAYEVGDYIRQGARDKQTYILLSFLPWLIITYVCFHLFDSSIEIAHINLEEVNIYETVFSRLPFTAIASLIIFCAFKVSEIFINNIIEINNQKLRLSEVGIIAKDVSDAASDNLGMTDEELFEIRTKLKMEILRHHLKKLDPEKFEYNISTSIWEKYLNRLKPKSKTDEDEETA